MSIERPVDNQSDLLRRLAKSSLREANLCDADLAQYVQPWISPATLGRLLNTNQILTAEQIEIVIHGLTVVTRRMPEPPWCNGSSSVNQSLLYPSDMSLARCLSLDRHEIAELHGLLEAAEAGSTRIFIYHEILPPFLLDDEAAEEFIRSEIERCASDPNSAACRLRSAFGEEREAFM